MERHGSESYFVVGEGLLGESVGGRARTLSAADEAAVPPFRFSRMGPSGAGSQLGEANRTRLGNAMAAGGGGASQIPAGYTYLGQFVDHDLTFDRTSVMFGANVSPPQLLQARSPNGFSATSPSPTSRAWGGRSRKATSTTGAPATGTA